MLRRKMFMRKCLSLVFLLCPIVAFADKMTEEQARDAACRFVCSTAGSQKSRALSSAPQMSLAFKMGSTDSPLYVFNRDGNGGYVVVAGDDNLDNPVVGWADEGNLDEKHLSPALRNLLQEYQKQMEFLRLYPASARKAMGDGNGAQVVVAPLIKTRWNQAAHTVRCSPQSSM